MELKSPPLCPKTVTIRRNPHRRARPTPFSAAPLSQQPSSKPSSAIRAFPIDDILSINIPGKPEVAECSFSDEPSDSKKLKVFLRIRPLIVTQPKAGASSKIGAEKNVWPRNRQKKDGSKMAKTGGKKNTETCLRVNDLHSVTLCPPQSLTDVQRTKTEVYEGFSHVFGDESSQIEVYEKMMNPLVVDFLEGKSGMLAAMGPSGSGKTHTVFGSTRQPGMVSLALCKIFSQNESCRSKCKRSFYLSMFEIYLERGKGEKIMDLSQEGGDLYMQQSNIKGLKEMVINDIQEAESLIACGMLKRSTAMTNSNSQSSRSQCIINIRCDLENLVEDQFFTSVLTIVDLAGAEREKRTGNQGARLLESSFINNTSMVFGQCLRSLLEHQKNPKKPLQKHFQNSMLTKYLREYLEGKKRMALILTAKSGEDDYHDTSYLLRQASPFMNIKFESIDEKPVGHKRSTYNLPQAKLAKRIKLSSYEAIMVDEVKANILHQPHEEEQNLELDKEVKPTGSSFQFPVNNSKKVNKKKSISGSNIDLAKKDREYQILSNVSRAMLKVLKEYKHKLEANENEADALRHNLIAEKERVAAFETELNLLKASCSCRKFPMAEENDQICDTSSIEVPSTLLNTEEQSSENDTLCEYVVFGKEDLMELGDKDFGSDLAESGVSDSEGDEKKHKEEEYAPAVSDSECLQKQYILDGTVTVALELNSDEVNLKSNDLEKFEEQSNEVFDKQEIKDFKERDANGDLTGYDNLESAICDSELNAHGKKFSSHEEDSNAHFSSPNPNESQSFQKQDILDDTGISFAEVPSISGDLEKFEDQSKEKVVSSPNVVCDNQEFKEVEERDVNVEVTVADEVCSSLDEVQPEQEEKEGRSFVEVSSMSCDLEKFEDQCMEKTDVSSPSVVCDNQELKEVEERDTNEVVTVADDVCSTLDEVQPEQEEKPKVDISSPNVLCDKQEVKEVEVTDANAEVAVSSSLEEIQPEQEEKVSKLNLGTSSDLKGSKSNANTQSIDLTEAPSQQSTLPEDVLISPSCNDSYLPEVPRVQPCMSVKPKRRLRPASSVMLKDINVLDFDDSTMPKQRNGRRGEREDGRKITQGSITLLRILKEQLNR